MLRPFAWLAPLVSLVACASPVGLEPDGSAGLPGSGGKGLAPGGGGAKSGPGGGGGLGGSSSAGGGSSGGSSAASGSGASGGSPAGTGGSPVGTGGNAAPGGSGGLGGGASSGGTGGAQSGGGGGAGGAGGTTACLPVVPGGLCNPVVQCGCGAQQNCDVAGPSGFTSCFPAGPKGAYQSCLSQTDCSKGTSCVSYACKPFCLADADCPLSGSKCVQVYMGAPVPGWKSCVASCALENPSARCGSGSTCMLVLPDTTDCVGGVGSGIGPGTCSPGNDQSCAPGHTCRPDGSCAKWCRVGQSDCAAGSSCSTSAVTVSVGGVQYGTCG
ncbi:MAG: hypothetical protein HYZ29_16600 [Myxococcales bacterium]|nr:hypothetical protein [Myxococcales bacterium]